MPWSFIGAVNWVAGEYGVYKPMSFGIPTSGQAYAVAMQYPGDTASTRLRTGFYYPYVTIQEREVVGPSEEMMLRLAGRDRTLHMLDYSYLNEWTNIRASITRYGVIMAPDRGILPATAQLWRFTP